MLVFWIILSVILALLIFILFALHPARRGADFSAFADNVYAHRGLYEKDQHIPENSLPAFRRAVEHGFGVELDIQFTADKQIVVFHDETLKRLCGIDRAVYEFTYQQLQEIPLAGTAERIPLFSDVLAVLNGQVPLIIEYKYYDDMAELCRAADALLRSYCGAYCIESFHPLVGKWYAAHRPEIVRGQLSENFWKHKEMLNLLGLCGTLQMMNFIAKPQFVAFRYTDRSWLPVVLCRKLFGAQMAYWTIRTQKELDDCRHRGALCIFEHFVPDVDSDKF